ncbi:cyclic nucleotide-binding domain-containing protein [Candidatus Uhrbacteria bacterium]|nr:cyclic nucleotide-binding domain-containing protein [Candidatus Uhrbacteria bacterium]
MNREILERHLVLPAITADALTALADAFEERSFTQGEALFTQGQPRGHTMMVLDGEIELKAPLGGALVSMIVFKPFDLLSARSLFEHEGIHHQSAIVRTPTATVAFLRTQDYQQLIERFPSIDRAMFASITAVLDDRLDHANRKLLSLMAVGHAASTSKSHRELGVYIVPLLSHTLRCTKVALLHRVADRWLVTASHGFDGEGWISGALKSNDEALLQLLKEQSSQWVMGDRARSLKDYGIREMIIAPCINGRDVNGALLIADRADGGFSVNTVLHMEIVSRIVAGGIVRLDQEQTERGARALKQRFIQPFA